MRCSTNWYNLTFQLCQHDTVGIYDFVVVVFRYVRYVMLNDNNKLNIKFLKAAISTMPHLQMFICIHGRELQTDQSLCVIKENAFTR